MQHATLDLGDGRRIAYQRSEGRQPGVVFRVTDTGGHFRGKEKRYRVMGQEPLDVRVASKKSRVVPESGGRIVKGDHFDRPGKEIAVTKFQGQEVSVGWTDDLELLGAEVLL